VFVFREPILKADQSRSPEWRVIHRIADDEQDNFERSFLSAVTETKEKVKVKEMAEGIERGNQTSVENSIDWVAFGAGLWAFKKIFQNIINKAGEATVRRLSKRLKMELRFDLLNPRAVEFINRHTGELITQITEESRQAIQAIIRRAFEEGGHPYQQARKIRNYIGLTERQMRAVDNYWARLAEDGTRSLKRVNEMADSYSRKLLRYRSKVIARTETMMAANEGQREAWRQAVDEGYLDPAEMEREWIYTPDERSCEQCMAMDGKRAPIEGAYEGGIVGPILHPQCRCTEGLVRRKL